LDYNLKFKPIFGLKIRVSITGLNFGLQIEILATGFWIALEILFFLLYDQTLPITEPRALKRFSLKLTIF